MRQALLERPPWYAAGLTLGLVVVAVAALLNQQLGIVGGFSSVLERVMHRTAALGWKAYFLFGVIGGGTVYSLLSGHFAGQDYGWLTRTFDGGSTWLVGLLLLLAGGLIGFGSKIAGGCTAGNGLTGCSTGSPASFLSTGIFFGTAIAASFVLRWLGAA
jgi:uncharacterized membrane protein YedE/YeeE